MPLPKVSIVFPTYNCAPLLQETLKSLDALDYPRSLQERLIVDGGSTDGTRELASAHGFRIIENPRRSNLYGLPLAFAAATGDLILHLDDDNVPDRPDWLTRMVEPFRDPAVVAAEPLFYVASSADDLVTRYVSVLGADDPLVVYAGFHDKLSGLTGTWTGVPHAAEDRGNYLVVRFQSADVLPTLACNAFLARREALVAATKTPWLHIDGARRMLRTGNWAWAKVKVGIVNHHAAGMGSFFVKKFRRLRTRSREAGSFEYQYPLTRVALLRIVARCLLVFPLCADAVRGYRRRPDPAWALHPLFTLGTMLTYLLGYLRLRAAKAPEPVPLRVSARVP